MIHRHRAVHLQPNVIARLMGMDDAAVAAPTPPPPMPAAGTIHVQFGAQRRRTNKLTLQQLPFYRSYSGGNDDAEYSSPSSRLLCLNRITMMRVPGSGWRRRRHHPQEEEDELLQKMRQDLRAWQASKAPALLQTRRSSNNDSRLSSDSDGGSRSSLVLQAIAQDELVPLIKSNKDGVAQGDTSERAAAASEEPAAMTHDRDLEARTRDGHGHGHSHGAPVAQDQELPNHRHTPIVLLKPTTCSESETTTGGVAIGGGGQKTLLPGLPKLHRDANMSVLLQEVKNRVQRELALTAATTTARGGEVIKAPTWAIPPLQQQVTKETKEDPENKRRLFRRSESFRAFRRDRKRNATTTHASPEPYIQMKSQTVSPAHEESDASVSVLQPCVGGVPDGQSFRSECLTLTKHRDDDAASSSPRQLFRSFSAPESGFSFSSLGSRLFGDGSARSIKRGASEPAAAVTMTTKNAVRASLSSFIRGTVSSLRHSFSSRRDLPFRRKTHRSNKASLAEIHPARMKMPVCAASPPSHETFSLCKVAQANLSELPPSPVSPLEVAAGHSSRHFFSDLHFTLPPELSPKCLSEFEAPATVSESSFRTDITAVEAAWSRDKAYITELLIAAGLYDDDNDGPSSINARVDSMARPMPICDDVFEDVEDMYYYRGDYIVGGAMYEDGTDHRMLFDLANEALQSLVAESSRDGSWSLRRWVVDRTGVSRGKKLVDDVWRQVQALRNNPQAQEMQTIEGMVAYEVPRCVWAEVLYEDVYVVGRKIERAIFDELIEDLFACAGQGFS